MSDIKKQPKGLLNNNFVKTMLLLPYGRQLLRPTAGVWIFFMSVLAVCMATVEGSVWGITSSVILPPEYQLATVVIGILVGVFIWIFDASLITFDTSMPIYKLDKPEKLSFLHSIFSSLFGRKLGWGILTRLLILSLSVFVTAPLLGQIFLDKEITRRIDDYNNTLVSQAIEVKSKEYQLEIQALKDKQDNLENDLKTEIAGDGQSGSYGYGPVAKQIERQLESTKERLLQINDERDQALTEISNMDVDTLTKTFGLSVKKDNFETRTAIQDEIRDDLSGAPKSEILAVIFLVLIFSVMVILKIFQGKSVEIYYNDQLQELYEKYLGGYFNDVLPEKELPSSAAPMSPYRFNDWIYNTFAASKETDVLLKKNKQAEADIDDAIANFQRSELDQQQRVNELRDQRRTILAEQDLLLAKRQNHEVQYKSLTAELTDIPARVEGVENAIKDQNIVGGTSEAFKMLNELTLKKRMLESELEKSDVEKRVIDRQLEMVDQQLLQNQVLIDQELKVLASLTETRHRLQLDQLDIIEEEMSHALSRLKQARADMRE